MSSPAMPPAPQLPAIGPMFGPPLVGIMIACMLFGSMWNQCILYFTRFPQDRVWLKCYVGWLLILDLVGTIFAIWWIYDLLVDNYGNFAALQTVTFRLAIHPVMAGVQAISCQLFFIWRVKILTKRIWATIPLLFFCVVSLVCTVGLTAFISINTDLAKFYDPLPHAIGAIWLAGTAFLDISITVILSFYLKHRRTGFQKTDHILNKIIAGTVQNGLITSACATLELGAFLGLPHVGLHIGLVFVLPKVYSNTVMSSLNGRRREGRNPVHTAGTDYISQFNSGPAPSAPMFVSVNTEVHEMGDTKILQDNESAHGGRNTSTSTFKGGAI